MILIEHRQPLIAKHFRAKASPLYLYQSNCASIDGWDYTMFTTLQ